MAAINSATALKMNMEAEYHPIEKDTHIQRFNTVIIFGFMLACRGVINSFILNVFYWPMLASCDGLGVSTFFD